MTSQELVLILGAITTFVGTTIAAIAGLVTAIAAWRKISVEKAANETKAADQDKQSDRLKHELEDERNHSKYQDEVILDLHRKIGQYQEWGQRMGRKMNQMELAIGDKENAGNADDTQPIKVIPRGRDWATGRMGPIDLRGTGIDQDATNE